MAVFFLLTLIHKQIPDLARRFTKESGNLPLQWAAAKAPVGQGAKCS